jgi:hypothetical protein
VFKQNSSIRTDNPPLVQVAGTPMQLFLPHTIIFRNGALHEWYYSNSVRRNSPLHCATVNEVVLHCLPPHRHRYPRVAAWRHYKTQCRAAGDEEYSECVCRSNATESCHQLFCCCSILQDRQTSALEKAWLHRAMQRPRAGARQHSRR